MPLPKPKKYERKQKFIGRCMSSLKKEFPNHDQRVAVCFSLYRDAKGIKKTNKVS